LSYGLKIVEYLIGVFASLCVDRGDKFYPVSIDIAIIFLLYGRLPASSDDDLGL